MIERYLSIWEIAHRWRDINPDETDPEKLPTNIQDSIRYMCRAALTSGITLSQIEMFELEDKRRSGLNSEVRYYEVTETPPEILSATSRKYNKDALDTYLIEANNFFDYCLNDQAKGLITTVDFPSCWSVFIDAGSQTVSEQNSIESNQLRLPPHVSSPRPI